MDNERGCPRDRSTSLLGSALMAKMGFDIGEIVKPTGFFGSLASLQITSSGSRAKGDAVSRSAQRRLNAAHVKQGVKPVVADAKSVTGLVGIEDGQPGVQKPKLSGRWKKNYARSDDMDALYEAARLPWVLRHGERFLRYLELEENDHHFRRTFNAGGFLNISEVYPKSGETCRLSRRDQRSGKMDGRLESTEQGPATVVSWNDPHALEMYDTFNLSEDGMSLTVYTTAVRKDKSCRPVTVKNVFTRLRD